MIGPSPQGELICEDICWNGGFFNFKVSKLVKSLLSLPLKVVLHGYFLHSIHVYSLVTCLRSRFSLNILSYTDYITILLKDVLDDLKLALYTCPICMNPGIDEVHSYLNTMGDP